MLRRFARRPILPMMTRKTDSCPICAKPGDSLHAPFCSRGCKDRDLLQWLGDGYRLPGPPANSDKPLDSEL